MCAVRLSRPRGYAAYVLSLLMSLCASAAAHPVEVLLVQAKNAVGGAAWNTVRNQRYSFDYLHADDGDGGEGDGYIDFSGGRFAARVRFNPVTISSWGTNDRVSWTEEFSKVSLREVTPVTHDRSEMYRQSYGYWFSSGRPAKAMLLGRRSHGGRQYQVVRVTPTDGSAFDFWINLANHRVERRFERIDGVETVIDYADFRRVGKVWLPFQERRSRDAMGHSVVIRLNSASLNADVTPESYAPPKDERIEGFAGAGASLTIPFDECDGHICIEVALNGHGPFHFVLDTGARNALSQRVFKQMQLSETGKVIVAGVGPDVEHASTTRIERTGLGALTLHQQDFMVISALDQTGIDGLLGYEWLLRAPVLIDYTTHRLTWYEPGNFHYSGKASATPLYFDHMAPRIDGVLDGFEGRFGVDTGSELSLTLTKSFMERYGLMKKYAGTDHDSISSSGVGGASNLIAGRGALFRLGGVAIQQPALELSMDDVGVINHAKVAGNIGNGVLRQMKVLFDYPHQTVYLERAGGE